MISPSITSRGYITRKRMCEITEHAYNMFEKKNVYKRYIDG